MKTIQTWLDKLPHWLYLGLALAVGVFWQNLKDQPDFVTAITTWDTKNILNDLLSAGGVTLVAVIGWLKTDPWAASASKLAAKAAAVKPLGVLMMLVGAIVILPGCSKPPPPNFPQDLQAEEVCVYQKLTSGDTVLSSLAACVGGDIVLAEDVVEWILSGKSGLNVSPATIDTVKLNIAADRAVRASAHK